MTAPRRLRADHSDNPFGTTNPRPRLSWQLPTGSRNQLAYQVQAENWDSGRVESGVNVLVDVPFPPLSSRERRTWRVRVWTDLGPSTWSDPAVMEAGLLDTADWSARWIGPAEFDPAPPGHRPAYLLRNEFPLTQPVAEARAYVTAHGIYELFVNGVRVGDAELTPGFTDYPAILQVQTYDIGSLLIPGSNVIGVVLSDGWFRGINGMFRDFNCFGDRTALLAQVHIQQSDGAESVVCTGPGWRSTVGAILKADLLYGMTVDLRREPVGWSTSGFDDSGWDAVTVTDHPLHGLVSSPAPPVRRSEQRRPLSVTRAPSGAQVVDLGENIVGWVRLTELGPAGTETTLTYAEALSPAGEVSQRNLLPDHVPPGGLEVSAGQVDRVISAGRPGEVFEPRHATKGFRYVEVTGAVRDLIPDDVTGIVVHTDLRPVGSFRCSDARLERLHEVAVRSFLGNAVDVPTDCPTRERSAWTGDWAVFVQPAAFLFDVAGFTEKWLRDLASQQYPDGVVPNYIPDQLGARTREHPLLGSNLGSAGWGDAAVIVPWEIYRSTGDRDLLDRQWPSMVAWVERAIAMAGQGRHPDRIAARPAALAHEKYLWDTGFHFGEWLEPAVQVSWEELKTADYSAVATAYLRLSTRLLARIASVRGDREAAARYEQISEQVREAWQTEYVTESGMTVPDTQATLVRALAFDLVGDSLRPVIADRLIELVRKADTHLGTGFLATPHLLPALADHGAVDLAYELLYQDSPPSWMHMLDHGATTIWELWEAIDRDGVAHESLNHYSKGAVIGFLHRYVAGLRSIDDGPAYQHFRVEPRPGGGLTWAEATHESPYGRIEVGWRIHQDNVRLRVLVPPGATAQVVLPDGQSAEVGSGVALFEFPRKATYPVSTPNTRNTLFDPMDGKMRLPTRPIVPGFMPDPSVCRAGDSYYLVNSSFEYAPGVPIHRSADLHHWEQIGNVLDRPSQLNLRKAKSSHGVFAPSLRFHDGRFWMITTNMTAGGGHLLVTADDPAGPWSDPIYIEVGGIDPDLCWDDDGTCYLTWSGFGPDGPEGIVQVTIDPDTGAVLSDRQTLWQGTGGKFPEGPHLYRIGDYWYLLLAEGGTERGHAATIARSTSPTGPFEASPHNPLLTARSSESPVQNTGHADLVQQIDGTWAVVYLGVRPRGTSPGWHVLGRETFASQIDWQDGWPVLADPILPPDEIRRGTMSPAALPLSWISLKRFPNEVLEPTPNGWLITAPATGEEAFVGLRQATLYCAVQAELDTTHGRGGLELRIDPRHALRIEIEAGRARAIAQIGSVKAVLGEIPTSDSAAVEIRVNKSSGHIFSTEYGPDEIVASVIGRDGPAELGRLDGRYISTEVAGGMTGRVIGVVCEEGSIEIRSFAYLGRDAPDFDEKREGFGA